MPTILLKKSDTASSVPTTSQLTNLAGGAEVAVNTADKRLFTMNSSSAVVELGTNPSSLTVVTGANLATTSGNVGIGTTTTAAGGLLTLNRAPAAAFGTPMLQVGGASFTSGGYYSVGFGFTDATYTEPPGEIAFATTSDSGGTLGSIVFGTRSVTTNTAVTERMRITSTGNLLVGTTTDVASRSGTISDISGNVRAIPRVGSAKTSTYTLSISDVGQYVELGTGGGVDVPNGIFSTGDVVSVFNNTTGNRTISLTITTAYLAGTDADKNSVTLATRGIATILFISNSVCVLTGNLS